MSSSSKKSSSGATVKRGTFLGLTITLLILLVIFLVAALVFFFAWRATLANLQNNICPVRNTEA
jgi:preprotein translocase subunit SecG